MTLRGQGVNFKWVGPIALLCIAAADRRRGGFHPEVRNLVMAGLVPAIHVFLAEAKKKT
jgi:hypothetical protein